MIKYLDIDEVVLITENKIKGSMFETLGAKQFLDRFINKGQLMPIYYFDGYAVLHHHAPLDFKDIVIKNIWRIEGYFKDDHSMFVENAKTFKHSIPLRDSAFKGLSNSIFKLNQNAGYIHEIVASHFVGDDEMLELIEKSNLEHGRSYKKSHARLFNEKPIYERAYGHEDIRETILIDRNNVFFDIEDINNIFEQLPVNTGQHIAAPAMNAAPYQNNNQDNQRIAELEKQLKQAHADNDLLRKKLDSNKEIQPNSQAAVARLLNVLFYKADYDITAHQGTTNTKIQKLSKEMGTPVGEKFISKWIKIVNSEKMGDEG